MYFQMHLLLLLLVFVTSTVSAQDIYKSVDEEGNVTYSAEPPAEPETVTILETAPEPSKDQVDAAQEQMQELEDAHDAFVSEHPQESQQQSATDDVTIEAGYQGVGEPVVRRNVRKTQRHRSQGRR